MRPQIKSFILEDQDGDEIEAVEIGFEDVLSVNVSTDYTNENRVWVTLDKRIAQSLFGHLGDALRMGEDQEG